MSRVVRFLVVLVSLVGLSWPAPPGSAAADDGNDGLRYGGDQHAYVRSFDDGLNDLDAYWRGVFTSAALAYRPPAVHLLDASVASGCGPADTTSGPFYCPRDETIYLSFAVFDQVGLSLSDYMVITITAHEWGHHVQHVLGVLAGSSISKEVELQADCLAGAFTDYAADQGRLDPGDVSEAATISILSGDSHAAGGHGINDERLLAFMDGYRDGLDACRLPLGASGPAVVVPTRPAAAIPAPPLQRPSSALTLESLLPPTLLLPQGQPFRLEAEGGRSLDEIAAGFPDPVEAARLLREWGWQENAYRNFASDNPPRDAVGWVELSYHRFATADGAAAALPYYAEARGAGTALRPINLGLFGDQAAAVAGPAFNGQELTIYARRGNVLIRATGIAPVGDPTADMIDVALIPLLRLIDEPRLVSPEFFALLPNQNHVPPELRLVEEHARSASTTATSFADPAATERLFEGWGWRESASRVFVGDRPTSAGTTRLEVVAYRWVDEQAAAEALVYFLDTRAAALRLTETTAPPFGDEARAISGPIENGREATVYARVGPVLLRFSAIGAGDPMVDLRALLG